MIFQITDEKMFIGRLLYNFLLSVDENSHQIMEYTQPGSEFAGSIHSEIYKMISQKIVEALTLLCLLLILKEWSKFYHFCYLQEILIPSLKEREKSYQIQVGKINLMLILLSTFPSLGSGISKYISLFNNSCDVNTIKFHQVIL